MHTAYCFIKTKEEATKNERRIFMNRFLKRILAGALSLAMAAGLAAMPANTAEAKEDLAGKLVVIHTNDIHGRYENNEESLGM